MKKRLLSALLALVMVLALLPASVFAADAKAAKIEIPVTWTTEPTWANGDSIAFTSSGGKTSINATATYDGSKWTVAVNDPADFGGEFASNKLTLTAKNAGSTDLGTLGTVSAVATIATDNNTVNGSVDTTEVKVEEGTAADTTPTATKLTFSKTEWASAQWKVGDKVTIKIGAKTKAAGDDVTIVATATAVNASSSTWTCTGAPTGYNAAFDGKELTLTPQSGATIADPLVQDDLAIVTSSVVDQSGKEVTDLTKRDGGDEGGAGGGTTPEKPDWGGSELNTTRNPSAYSNSSKTDGKAAKYYGTNVAQSTGTGGAVTNTGITGAPGWYVAVKEDNVTTNYRVDQGYLVGTTYYSTLPAKWSGNITVIGSTGSIYVPDGVSTLNVDVYPNGTKGTVSLSITGGKDLGTVKVTDSKYVSESHNLAGQKVKVTLSNSWATNKTSSLTLTDVDAGDISFLTGGYSRSVTLENCSADSITMNGVGLNGKNMVSAKQTLTIKKSENSKVASTVGSITVTGNQSDVKLADVTVSSGVTLTGDRTNLEVSGMSDTKNVAIQEGAYATARNALTTIKVTDTNAKVGNITFPTSTGGAIVTGKATITVTAGEVGDINMSDAKAEPAISVNHGQTGDIKVKSGTVTVSGTYAKIAGLELDGNASFTMNDTNHEVKGIEAKTSNVKISVPPDFSNKLQMKAANALDNYKGHGIQGGTWLVHPVPAAALHSSLVYQLNIVNATTYNYYNQDQLNQALVSQFKNADAGGDQTKGVGSNAILTGVGQTTVDPTNGKTYYELQFKNGKTLWGTMLVGDRMQIKLPTMINTVTVNKWADEFHSDRLAGSMYSTPLMTNVSDKGENVQVCITGVTEKVWELNASGGLTSGDVTKITDISVKSKWPAGFTADSMGDVKATLSGNVISLSGAVPAGTSEMTLYLTTDAIESKVTADPSQTTDEDVPVTIKVPVIYYSNSKTLQFDTMANDDLRRGVTVEWNENTLGVLRLSNGTKYTLNGSGLSERADNITVVDSSMGSEDWFKHNYIEVNVNVSTITSPVSKNALIERLNGSGAVYDWKNSPAVREAVNAALATLGQTTVDGFIKAAQTAAWRAVNGNGTPSTTDLAGTGYDAAFLVPYLQVNVTAYDPNGTLTATLVPSWRVEVRQTNAGTATDKRFSTAFATANSKISGPPNVYVAKAGAALSLGTNVSEITDLTFDAMKTTSGVLVKFANLPFTGDVFMHQDNTYAYKKQTNGSTADSFLIKHNGGSSLGTVTINTTEPLVKLYNKKTDAAPAAYFDTLQAAVNDAQDQQHIDVDQNYKGSLNVTVTGYARTFTIQSNGQNVVLANASGGLTIQNNTGSEYTVQLGRNSTAVVEPGSVTIAVSRVSNGTATVNATTAKAGATVTVTCTPATGYRTSNVTASARMIQNDTNVAVTVTKVSDNVYTFKVPEGASSVTVTPAFVVGTASAIPFNDVATNHWAYNSVKYVWDNGLMNGVDTYGTVFGGNQNLTRAMVVTILYRAANSPYVGTSSSFSDVANNTWYSQAVAWANQNGIVTGYANGTFQPNWNITRQELATILYRYNTNYKGRATTGSTTLANFPDQGNVSNWATAGMQWAVGNGIVNGITNGVSTTLSPAGSATRYEAATMLMRYGQGMGL